MSDLKQENLQKYISHIKILIYSCRRRCKHHNALRQKEDMIQMKLALETGKNLKVFKKKFKKWVGGGLNGKFLKEFNLETAFFLHTPSFVSKHEHTWHCIVDSLA